MSGSETRQDPADDRQSLAPGARIGNAYLILKAATSGAAALSYEALRLADQTNVLITEAFPRGLAARADDGRVAAVRGWEAEFEAALARFVARSKALAGLAAPALVLPVAQLDDQGTVYVVTPAPGTPSLSGWASDLMRRPSDADLARLALRLAEGVQALHGTGLAHGTITDRHLHLAEPGDICLTGLLLEDANAETAAAADIHAIAAALYSVITGRQPPPRNRDRSLDARFAARHMAAGDYADPLLETVDAALELGEGAEPVQPAAWLAGLIAVARGLLGEAAPVTGMPAKGTARASGGVAAADGVPDAALAKADAAKPVAKPVVPKPVLPKAPANSSSPGDAVAAGAGKQGRSMRFAALAGIVLVGIAAWLGFLLLGNTPNPPSAPRIATPAPVPAPPATPTPPPAVATAPAPVTTAPPATPEPPKVEAPKVEAPKVETPKSEPARPEPQVAVILPEPPPIPPPPSRPVVTSSEIEAATTREALEALLARGAAPEAVAARLQALGFVAVSAAGETVHRKPGEGEAWRDCTICPELVLVPPGRTSMQVTIADVTRQLDFAFDKPLAVARFEVTRGQYAAFVRETGRPASAGCAARKPEWGVNPSLSWDNPGFAQGDDHPVVCVNLLDAQAYAEWLSARTGQRYRLPTDAEWHYLAAAERWPDREPDQLCRIGNGADQSALAANPGWQAATCQDGFAETAPVGRFAPGPWGLHDLNGNVWEWVSTCAPDPTPDAVFPPRSCAPGAPRLLRGGSWADAPRLRQLDSRVISAPTVRDQVAGFRVVREP